ncbi:uncharacterized protein [Leptinotarsa decemlineata]|uniref:uncharacterized protein n=1 Tax=Leptinotarsa decemlineata TaxID=7539 RepID=UPI000C25223A|nr:uncharacterized protein LOC111503214 [Leptinotarsa decemlineata]
MPLRVGCRADDADKHEFDINFLLYHKGILYSAGDDGKVMAWAPDLKKLAEVQSNQCSVFCLAASDDTLYSCSNEGTIKSFELKTLKEKEVITKDDQAEYWRVSYSDGCLYSGDHEGYIKVWKDGKFYGSLNIAEPIKDMAVFKNLIFTVKDLDLVITDMKLEGEKLRYGTKNNFMGRAPVTTIGEKYFSFVSREGMDIILHENNSDSHFKALSKTQNAHEKIINALAGASWDNKDIIFSGGWDKQLKKWTIVDNNLKEGGSCDVEIVINAIAIGDKGELYVGGADGHIVRIEVE